MNFQAIKILFLKDLFLCRRYLFGYLVGALVSSLLAVVPDSTVSFIGFLLMMTVAIASGIHMIGNLLLAESTDQTRLFVMSMPVSLLDYSIGKMGVVLATYLIPWSTMLALSLIGTFVLPEASKGAVIVLLPIFLFLMASFMLQLAAAVISESVGMTICVMVAGNVLLNVFLMKLFAIPEIKTLTSGDVIVWPVAIQMMLLVEILIIGMALGLAFWFQTRTRDLI
jgi:hypothetical protein